MWSWAIVAEFFRPSFHSRSLCAARGHRATSPS